MNRSLYRILDALADNDINYSNIGTLAFGTYGGTSDSAVSVPSDSSWHTIKKLTFAKAGIYLVKVACRWTYGSMSGQRQLCIDEDEDGTPFVWNVAKTDATSSTYTFQQVVTVVEVLNDNTDFYIRASQNSGSSLNVAPRYAGIYLRDSGANQGSGVHTVGVTDYPDLTNKPQINGVSLVGDISLAQLGIGTLGFSYADGCLSISQQGTTNVYNFSYADGNMAIT